MINLKRILTVQALTTVLLVLISVAGIIATTVQSIEIKHLREGETMLQGGDIKSAETIDSLTNELFISNTTIDRYEIAIDNLREKDSAAAKKYEQELSHIE